ncbi:hypothetical protein MMU07_19020 [Aquiflexum sp. LQ15W]|uniref:hypothetical protein n=1 Tax=Cognataquiflexum nitidum TaxID=2922272 RepID=UPI001F130F4E|nr:hypothetical protein [Cognataquiflexum nitidum]MCH6201680.1 hypothetical protein [Cognataquiflexum nitidum]
MKLKYAFFIFLLLTVIAFGMMRYHQFQFESETGLKFNVMEFELPGSLEKLNELIATWGEPEQKAFVLKQLQLDYLFMSTLFPSIFILCLWARKNSQVLELRHHTPDKFQFPKNLLLVLAAFQVLALLFDISENIRLTHWIQQGSVGNMALFETMVKLKFFFAIVGLLGGLVMILITQSKVGKIQKIGW